MIKLEVNMKKRWFIILLFFALIPMVSAFEITTDEVTSTSIVWNLSQKPQGVTIEEIALDGIVISDFSVNATRIVQSNLYPDETHIITITDSSETISEKEVVTSSKTTTQSDTLFTTINLYILILLSLLFVVGAIYTRVYFLAFIGSLITIVGIVGSLNNNFITGWIFGIMLIVTLYVGFNTS